MEGGAQQARWGQTGAALAVALALAVLVIIFITFRGLVFLTLPLAIAALVLGIVGGRRAQGGGDYATAMVGIVLAIVALLLSLLALAATILISRDYDVYDISSPVPKETGNGSGALALTTPLDTR